MKKGTKAVIGILALGVVGFGIFAYSHFSKKNQTPSVPMPTQEDERNYEENKKKFEDIVDKDPNDIVISEDLTPEQKVALQEEKDYWALNNQLKYICQDFYNNSRYKTYKIDRLLYNPNNNSLLCFNQQYAEIEIQDNGEYAYTKNIIYPNLIEIRLKQPIDDFSLSNIATVLQDGNNYTSGFLSTSLSFENEAICEAIYNKNLDVLFKRGSYLDGKDFEYVDSFVLTGGLRYPNIPSVVSYLVSTKENDEITYHIFEVDVTYYFKTTEEEMLAYIKDEATPDMSIIRSWTTGIKDVDFDWQELTDKYNDNFKTTEQSAEASAAEFGEFDENGNMVSFDYRSFANKQASSVPSHKTLLVSDNKFDIYSQQM